MPYPLQDDRLGTLLANPWKEHQFGEPCPIRIEPDPLARGWQVLRKPRQTLGEELNSLEEAQQQGSLDQKSPPTG
jgi:hypothetical protein